MVSVIIGQLLLCGLLPCGLPGTLSDSQQTADWGTHHQLLFAVDASDGHVDIPDTQPNLSTGNPVRPTGADEVSNTRLRRDLGSCRPLVFQPAIDSILTPTIVLPPLAIVSRGIRLRI